MDDSTVNRVGTGIGVFFAAISAMLARKASKPRADLELRITHLEADRERLDRDREETQTLVENLQRSHAIIKRQVDRLKDTQDEKITILTEEVQKSAEAIRELVRLVKRSIPQPDAQNAQSRLT